MKGLCFDYTRPTNEVIQKFCIGRDRYFGPHADNMCEEIIGEATVRSSDGGYFWKKYLHEYLGPAIKKMQDAVLSFHDKSGFPECLVSCYYNYKSRGSAQKNYIDLFGRMHDYICKAIGTERLLVVTGGAEEDCKAFANMVGRGKVVFITGELSHIVELSNSRHQLSQIVEDTVKELMQPGVSQVISPFMDGVIEQVKGLVPSMKPPVFIRIPDGMRPAIYIKVRTYEAICSH